MIRTKSPLASGSSSPPNWYISTHVNKGLDVNMIILKNGDEVMKNDLEVFWHHMESLERFWQRIEMIW